MKHTDKKESGLHAYLKPFLNSGDPTVIAQAKQEYRRRYKAAWRKEKRKTQKTFEISFAPQEWRIIKQAKQKHNRSYTSFIKLGSLAYCEKKYLVPDQLAYNMVYQALHMVYHKLRDIEEDNRLPKQQGEELLHLFTSIENAIKQQLQHPQTLEEAISEAIRTNPTYTQHILQLLQTVSR